VTLSKKKSRSIVVHDRDYRWLVKQSGDEPALDLEVFVQASETPGQIIFTQIEHGKIVSISPRFIREFILYALDRGWEAHQKGKITYYEFAPSKLTN
jgi:hypothetical protein